MITGINLVETQDHVSKFDKGDMPTIWKIGIVNSEVMPIVMANESETLETMTMFVRFGLKGFENFKTSDGKEIRYKTEPKVMRGKQYHVLADDVLKIIPTAVIIELGMEIMKLGNLNEDEIKNS